MGIKEIALKYEQMKRNLGASHSALQITDNREVIADGCRKIVNCDDCLVVIEQARCRVTIAGCGLKLRNWGTDGVTVSGVIQSVEFAENLRKDKT